jgi:hypothetical protein
MKHLFHYLLLAGIPAAIFAIALRASAHHQPRLAAGNGHPALDPFALAMGARVAVAPRTVAAPRRSESHPAFETKLRFTAAAATAAAGAVHASVTAEHFKEFWLFGVFFIGAAAAQIAWAAMVMFRPQRRLLMLGLAGNAAIVLLWAFTRFVGLPLGPGAGTRESMGLVDIAATAYEVLAVAFTAALLKRHGERRLV